MVSRVHFQKFCYVQTIGSIDMCSLASALYSKQMNTAVK